MCEFHDTAPCSTLGQVTSEHKGWKSAVLSLVIKRMTCLAISNQLNKVEKLS